MKSIYKIAVLMLASPLLINWGGQATSQAGRFKQPVNLYGNVITQAGNDYKVDNIAIGYMYKQIPVYEMQLGGTDTTTKALATNPKDGIITKLDLIEISEIHVPHPRTTWTFNKTEFIELEIISKNNTKTKNSYLIEKRRKITCTEINDAGPVEKEIPFHALKKIMINGYRHRDEKDLKTDA